MNENIKPMLQILIGLGGLHMIIGLANIIESNSSFGINMFIFAGAITFISVQVFHYLFSSSEKPKEQSCKEQNCLYCGAPEKRK